MWLLMIMWASWRIPITVVVNYYKVITDTCSKYLLTWYSKPTSALRSHLPPFILFLQHFWNRCYGSYFTNLLKPSGSPRSKATARCQSSAHFPNFWLQACDFSTLFWCTLFAVENNKYKLSSQSENWIIIWLLDFQLLAFSQREHLNREGWGGRGRKISHSHSEGSQWGCYWHLGAKQCLSMLDGPLYFKTLKYYLLPHLPHLRALWWLKFPHIFSVTLWRAGGRWQDTWAESRHLNPWDFR